MSRKFKPAFPKEFYEKEYTELNKSPYQIGSENNITHTKVRADLKFYEISQRTLSESMINAIKEGRKKHPTAGRTRTQEEKDKIAHTKVKTFDATSQEHKEKLKEAARQRYMNMSDEEKASWHQKSTKALKDTTLNGSKLERYLLNRFRQFGFKVEHQRDLVLKNTDLKIDLYFPELKLAVEVDGIFHKRDVYSEGDKFGKRILRDNEKNGLLLVSGHSVIRLGYPCQLTNVRMEQVFEELVKTINNLNETEKQLIHMEFNRYGEKIS